MEPIINTMDLPIPERIAYYQEQYERNIEMANQDMMTFIRTGDEKYLNYFRRADRNANAYRTWILEDMETLRKSF